MFGIRFLLAVVVAAQTNWKREGGASGGGEVDRPALRHYSAQPIRFPREDVSQEQLARQRLNHRLFRDVDVVGYFLSSNSIVLLHF